MGRGIEDVDIEIEKLQQEGNTNLMTFIDDEREFMKAALLESGVEIEAVNSLGSTALLCCAEEGRLILMKTLLQNVPKANTNAADKVKC
jgi:ankyrin repeat protein